MQRPLGIQHAGLAHEVEGGAFAFKPKFIPEFIGPCATLMRASWKKHYKIPFAHGRVRGGVGILAGAIHDVGETVTVEQPARIRRSSNPEAALVDSGQANGAER